MMKPIKNIAIVALLLLVSLGATSCLEEKVIDVILKSVPIQDYYIDDDNENYAEPATVMLGQEIKDALEDGDFGLDDLDDAYLVKVEYGVFEFEHSHDWITSGSIQVSASTGPRQTATIITYTDVSIEGALGERLKANLVQAGVDVVNDALNTFIESEGAIEPILTFTVLGGDVSPDPSPSDRIQFGFRGWLTIQVIVKGEVEVFELF